jgi:hypothetical protein
MVIRGVVLGLGFTAAVVGALGLALIGGHRYFEVALLLGLVTLLAPLLFHLTQSIGRRQPRLSEASAAPRPLDPRVLHRTSLRRPRFDPDEAADGEDRQAEDQKEQHVHQRDRSPEGA